MRAASVRFIRFQPEQPHPAISLNNRDNFLLLENDDKVGSIIFSFGGSH